jgi:predicted XRE-type DNA-binding protein
MVVVEVQDTMVVALQVMDNQEDVEEEVSEEILEEQVVLEIKDSLEEINLHQAKMVLSLEVQEVEEL